jgi:hypothetical protein
MTSDDELMDALRRAADVVDPVPDVVALAASAALSTRHLDAELAALLLDSDTATAEVRSAGPAERLLSFEADGVSVELQITYGTAVSLRGLVSGASGDAVVEVAGSSWEVAVDDEGEFAVADLPRGPLRIRLTADSGNSVTTSWVLL